MENGRVNPPLTNLQAELLKLFASNISDDDLNALKKVIANFLLERARDNADAIWDEKGYTNESFAQQING